MSSANCVMQFLLGLNEFYDSVVNNIILMDPLPPFNKVYFMISRIEKQKFSAVSDLSKSVEASALLFKASVESKKFIPVSAEKKKDSGKKEDRVCVHCGKQGHLVEECFKKHGYPYWV